jgi:lipoprotein-releasing system ATP-binding protein
MTTNTLLDLQNLMFSYPSQRRDSNGWSLRIDRLVITAGTIYCVSGRNMVGKTTLLRILAGLEEVSFSPQVRASGLLLRSNGYRLNSRARLRTHGTCFLSHSDRMFPELTLWENVLVAKNSGQSMRRKKARGRFDDYIATQPTLRGRSSKDPLGELSSGGQALIRLARAHTWESRLILIDEVTGHLDPESAKTFFIHLKARVTAGCSVLLVSHVPGDHDLVKRLANEIGAKCLPLLVKLEDHHSCLIEPSSS